MSIRDFSNTLGELDAGIFLKQASKAIEQVALSAIETQKAGEITLKLKIKPLNDSGAVHVESSIATVEPRPKGRIRMDHVSVTPMFAAKTGQLGASPETQDDIFFSTSDNVTSIAKAK